MLHSDVPAVHEIAVQAVLAMAARSLAQREFESDDEVHAVHIAVVRSERGSATVDLEFLTSSGIALGGLSL
jgi:hypothetical protein